MMAKIHLDVQLYDQVCIFLKEVWKARSAWNVLDCLILLVLLRNKILKVFRACGVGSATSTVHNAMFAKPCRYSCDNLSELNFYWLVFSWP